jgi:hypothetical protein
VISLSDVLGHGDPDQQSRRCLPHRQVVVVVIAVLLAGGGVGLAWLVGATRHASPTTTSSRPPLSSPTADAGRATNTRVIGSVAVAAGDQVKIVLVPGGAWLSSWTNGTLTRMAARRGPRVTSLVRIGQPSESVLSMVYAAPSLWVVDSSTNSLLALDPRSGRLQRRLRLAPWGGGDSVAFGAHSLWVACSGQLGNSGPVERVLRVDPATLRVLSTTALPGEGEDLTVVANATDVWVGGATPLAHISPRTRPATTRYSADARPLALNGGTLWTTSPVGLTALDAHTGRVVLNRDLQGPPPVVAADPKGRAWIPSSPGDATGVDLLRLTGNLFRFAQYAGRVDAVAVDDVSLWIYTGSLIILFDVGNMNID